MGDSDLPPDYSKEAEERWGQTRAYQESIARTKGYTPAEFSAAQAEADAAVSLFISAMDAGHVANSAAARTAAEAHRRAISNWYYECSLDMHVELAHMYLADSRFTAYYEKRRPGLAQYVHDAIIENAYTEPEAF